MLWFRHEGRARAKKELADSAVPASHQQDRESATHQPRTSAAVGGKIWKELPPEERVIWHVEANKRRAAYDTQQASLGHGRQVTWNATPGNACQICVKSNWVVGFILERIDEADGGKGNKVEVVYEADGDTHRQTLSIRDLKP